MTNKETDFEQMVDKAFNDYEKELKQKHGVPTLELDEIEFQKFQDIDIKEIEKILEEGSVNRIEL